MYTTGDLDKSTQKKAKRMSNLNTYVCPVAANKNGKCHQVTNRLKIKNNYPKSMQFLNAKKPHVLNSVSYHLSAVICTWGG